MRRSGHRLSSYPLGRVRIACETCKRRGSWSVARLAERHGAEIDLLDLLRLLTATCRWQRRPGDPAPRQYEVRCLARFPDLDDDPEPPRPAVSGVPRLRVVGGKG